MDPGSRVCLPKVHTIEPRLLSSWLPGHLQASVLIADSPKSDTILDLLAALYEEIGHPRSALESLVHVRVVPPDLH